MTESVAGWLGEGSPRIRAAEVFVVSQPLHPRIGVSIAWAAKHEYVLVRLVDSDGRVGWGETYSMPGMAQIVRDLASSLLGKPTHGVRGHRVALAATLASTYAVSAVLIALDDLRGHQLGVPMHQLYGGAVRDLVLTYAASPGYIEGIEPEDSWLQEVGDYVSGGFVAIKLRIGRYPIDREARLLAAVRDLVGPDVALAADGNGAYSMFDAVRMGEVLAELHFAWFEEPLPQKGYRRYSELAQKLRVTLAGGELLEDSDSAARLLRSAGVDVIQPEVVICGGPAALLEIADVAAMHGVPVLPHTSGGAIGITAALHVLACLPNFGAPFVDPPRLEVGRGINSFRTDILASGPDFDSGEIPIPTAPGLGIEVDEQYVRSIAASVTVAGS